MDLVPYTDADLWLTEALETDPAVMADLGGPWPLDRIPDIHQRRLAFVAAGAWAFTVVPEPGARAVGSVNLWPSEWDGAPVSEAGWMILPEHQGRGYATAAVRLLLERARADGRWGDIHAFTGVANGASNTLCRKVGFTLHGETGIDYGGRRLRCHHWIRPSRSEAERSGRHILWTTRSKSSSYRSATSTAPSGSTASRSASSSTSTISPTTRSASSR